VYLSFCIIFSICANLWELWKLVSKNCSQSQNPFSGKVLEILSEKYFFWKVDFCIIIDFLHFLKIILYYYHIIYHIIYSTVPLYHPNIDFLIFVKCDYIYDKINVLFYNMYYICTYHFTSFLHHLLTFCVLLKCTILYNIFYI
jgi:hypothetical protein